MMEKKWMMNHYVSEKPKEITTPITRNRFSLENHMFSDLEHLVNDDMQANGYKYWVDEHIMEYWKERLDD